MLVRFKTIIEYMNEKYSVDTFSDGTFNVIGSIFLSRNMSSKAGEKFEIDYETFEEIPTFFYLPGSDYTWGKYMILPCTNKKCEEILSKWC